MRQLRKRRPGKKTRKTREPLAEGPQKERRKYSAKEIRFLIKKREELAGEGKKDREIARIIAEEMEGSAGSVRGKIRGLVKEGRLEENENKRKNKKFSDAEIETIIKKREELAEEGKKDKDIARSVAKEMGRSAGSVLGKIRGLVKEGRLWKNENKHENKEFSDADIETIIRRRKELTGEGKKDQEIARSVAKEMGRSVNSVLYKMRKLVKEGRLGKNENKITRRPNGFFTKMSDDELVAYAKKIMKEKEIHSKEELCKADSGLYMTLWKRKLLDKVGFEEKHRDWASMSDDELVAYAKKFMKKKGINGRKELEGADLGLYEVLRKRKLLDRVFARIEKARQRQADDEVIRALEEFGG